MAHLLPQPWPGVIELPSGNKSRVMPYIWLFEAHAAHAAHLRAAPFPPSFPIDWPPFSALRPLIASSLRANYVGVARLLELRGARRVASCLRDVHGCRGDRRREHLAQPSHRRLRPFRQPFDPRPPRRRASFGPQSGCSTPFSSSRSTYCLSPPLEKLLSSSLGEQ